MKITTKANAKKAAESAIIGTLFQSGGTKTNIRDEKFSNAKFQTYPLNHEIDVKEFKNIVSLYYKKAKDKNGYYYQVWAYSIY